jgi:hypothetical protein
LREREEKKKHRKEKETDTSSFKWYLPYRSSEQQQHIVQPTFYPKPRTEKILDFFGKKRERLEGRGRADISGKGDTGDEEEA